MATQMLSLHWHASRWLLLPFVVAAFGLPLLAVQGLGGTSPEQGSHALEIVRHAEMFLPVFPALAAALGGVVAITAWSWDHRGNHVYALSLPIPRWEYALLKLGAGMALLAIPVTAFLAGSLLAAASVDLPAGLQAYPVAVSARFGMASLVAYALLFAMAASTSRTVVILLSTFVGGLVLGELGLQLAGQAWGVTWLEGSSFVEAAFQRLTEWPGPFQVFLGDWALIDV